MNEENQNLQAKKPYVIVTDSSALFYDQKTKILTKKLNLYFFYLHLQYQENEVWKSVLLNENFSDQEYLSLYKRKCDFKTSQPSPADCFNFITSLLQNYEKIFIFVLSEYISGTYNTLTQLIKNNKWQNNVILFHSVNFSAGLLSYCNELNNQLISNTFDLKSFSNFLEKHTELRFWIVFPNDFSYLKRSGRMSVTASSIVAMFHIKCSLLFEKKAEKLVIAHSLHKVFVRTFIWVSLQYKKNKIESSDLNIVVLVCFVNELKLKSCVNLLNKHFPSANIEVKPMPILLSVYNGIDSIVIYFEAKPKLFFPTNS